MSFFDDDDDDDLFLKSDSKTDNPAPKEETQVSTKQKKAPLPIFYAITSPANAYKYEGAKPIAMGPVGMAITGSPQLRQFVIIVYKDRQTIFANVTLDAQFFIRVLQGNYINFSDDTKTQWSFAFRSPVDLRAFTLNCLLAVHYMTGGNSISSMMLTPQSGAPVAIATDDNVTVKTTFWNLTSNGSLSSVIEEKTSVVTVGTCPPCLSLPLSTTPVGAVNGLLVPKALSTGLQVPAAATLFPIVCFEFSIVEIKKPEPQPIKESSLQVYRGGKSHEQTIPKEPDDFYEREKERDYNPRSFLSTSDAVKAMVEEKEFRSQVGGKLKTVDEKIDKITQKLDEFRVPVSGTTGSVSAQLVIQTMQKLVVECDEYQKDIRDQRETINDLRRKVAELQDKNQQANEESNKLLLSKEGAMKDSIEIVRRQLLDLQAEKVKVDALHGQQIATITRLEGQVNQLKGEKAALEDELRKAQEAAKGYQREANEHKENMLRAQEREQDAIKKLQQEIESKKVLKSSSTDLELNITELTNTIEENGKAMKKLQAKHDQEIAELTQQHKEEIDDMVAKLQRAEAQKAKLQQEYPDVEALEQAANAKTRELVRKARQEADAKLDATIQEAAKREEKFLERNKKAADEIKRLMAANKDLAALLSEEKKATEETQKQLEILSNESKEQITMLRNSLVTKEGECNEIRIAEKSKRDQLAEVHASLAASQAEISNLKSNLSQLEIKSQMELLQAKDELIAERSTTESLRAQLSVANESAQKMADDMQKLRQQLEDKINFIAKEQERRENERKAAEELAKKAESLTPNEGAPENIAENEPSAEQIEHKETAAEEHKDAENASPAGEVSDEGRSTDVSGPIDSGKSEATASVPALSEEKDHSEPLEEEKTAACTSETVKDTAVDTPAAAEENPAEQVSTTQVDVPASDSTEPNELALNEPATTDSELKSESEVHDEDASMKEKEHEEKITADETNENSTNENSTYENLANDVKSDILIDEKGESESEMNETTSAEEEPKETSDKSERKDSPLDTTKDDTVLEEQKDAIVDTKTESVETLEEEKIKTEESQSEQNAEQVPEEKDVATESEEKKNDADDKPIEEENNDIETDEKKSNEEKESISEEGKPNNTTEEKGNAIDDEKNIGDVVEEKKGEILNEANESKECAPNAEEDDKVEEVNEETNKKASQENAVQENEKDEKDVMNENKANVPQESSNPLFSDDEIENEKSEPSPKDENKETKDEIKDETKDETKSSLFSDDEEPNIENEETRKAKPVALFSDDEEDDAENKKDDQKENSKSENNKSSFLFSDDDDDNDDDDEGGKKAEKKSSEEQTTTKKEENGVIEDDDTMGFLKKAQEPTKEEKKEENTDPLFSDDDEDIFF